MKNFISINRKGGLITGAIINQEPETNVVRITLEDSVRDTNGKSIHMLEINADEPIRNLPGYLCSLFARMLKDNPDFESFEIGSGEKIEIKSEDASTTQTYLNGVPVPINATVSVELLVNGSIEKTTFSLGQIKSGNTPFMGGLMIEDVAVPKLGSNGIPKYTRNETINRIFFESGVAEESENRQKAAAILSENLGVLKAYMEQSDKDVISISLSSLKSIMYRNGGIRKKLSREHAVDDAAIANLYKQIDNELAKERKATVKGMVFDASSQMIVRIGKGWFS